MTRFGMLYRSGDLSAITDKDVALLEEIGLAMVIDFRSELERIRKPNRTIRSVREIKTLSMLDSTRKESAHFLAGYDREILEKAMIDAYRQIIREHHGEYRQFLNELAHTPHLPVVFHCTAGKDRTGMAAFFLLTALGVKPEAILDNYLVSNVYNTALKEKIARRLVEKGYDGESLQPLLDVKREYLEAALSEIRNQHGGLDAFVVEILQADTDRLKERFLEPRSGAMTATNERATPECSVGGYTG